MNYPNTQYLKSYQQKAVHDEFKEKAERLEVVVLFPWNDGTLLYCGECFK